MTDQPRRPILSLKGATGRPTPPPQPQTRWKCRPCGTTFDVPPDSAPDEPVRCPSCNARLGKAADFRADPPELTKLRARPVTPPPPKPAAPPVIKARRTIARPTPGKS